MHAREINIPPIVQVGCCVVNLLTLLTVDMFEPVRHLTSQRCCAALLWRWESPQLGASCDLVTRFLGVGLILNMDVPVWLLPPS